MKRQVESLEARRLLANTSSDFALVANIPGDSGEVVSAGDRVFFTSVESASGPSLWVIEAPGQRATLVAQFSPATVGARELTALGREVYFFADDQIHGSELWKSDGTPAGTRMVRDINLRNNLSPRFLQAVEGKLFFNAFDAEHGYEPWVSDGSDAGTMPLLSLPGGVSGLMATDFIPFNASIYFFVAGDTGWRGLWSTDGTPAGTHPIIHMRVAEPKDNEPVAVGSNLFFRDWTLMYVTDGSAAGTRSIGNIHYSGAGRSAEMTRVGEQLLFLNSTSATGLELWTADTSAVRLLIDIDPGPASAFDSNLNFVPRMQMIALGERAVFSADDGVHGSELWVTDGTVAGTRLLKDLAPGPAGSKPSRFNSIDGTVFFNTETAGVARTDGTPQHTLIGLSEIAGGGFVQIGAFLSMRAVLDDALFFQTMGSASVFRISDKDMIQPVVTQSADGVFDRPRSVSFSFSEDVSASITSGDGELINLDNGAMLTGEGLAFDFAGNLNRTVRITFPGFSRGIPPDGNYRFKFAVGSIEDAFGNPLSAPTSIDFFHQSGDVNHDRRVDNYDLGVLSSNFNRPATVDRGDFDYSGTVNIADMAILGVRFGQSLPPARVPRPDPFNISSERRDQLAAAADILNLSDSRE